MFKAIYRFLQIERRLFFQNKSVFYLYTFFFYLFVLTLALLYPYNFSAQVTYKDNHVKWFADTNGVELLSESAIFSSGPPMKLFESLVKTNELTIEVWLAAKDGRQKGPARIISYSHNKYLRNFTFGQEGKDMVLRLRTTKTNLNGTPINLNAKNVFLSNKPTHIITTYNLKSEALYVDGKINLKKIIPGGNFSNWDSSYSLILGNELSGDRNWNGKIFLVAIYNRSLSENEVQQNYQAGRSAKLNSITKKKRITDGLIALYLFDEKGGDIVQDKSGLTPPVNLNIPPKLKIINKVFLRPPYQGFTIDFKNLKDLIVNVIFFIPIGFLFHSLVSKRYQSSLKVISIVFVSGLLYTLSIESLQYFLNSRSSSMTDVVHNTIGVMLGIIADRIYFVNAVRS